jgi:hypothetical protein
MRLHLAFGFSSMLFCASIAHGASILYGGNGGHQSLQGSPLSINNGSVVTVDQATGVVTLVGHPTGVNRLSGIAFAGPDLLFGSTLGGGGFPDFPPQPNTSHLIQINPDSGALVSDIGPVTDGVGGPGIAIADLAIQPGTGVLFGLESTEAEGGTKTQLGNLYAINRTTGIASLVGTTGSQNASLAFAPNGTLYMTTASINPDDPSGPFIDVNVDTVDPSTGKILTSVPTSMFWTALAFNSDTGLLFGGTGGGNDLASVSGDIFTIDPATGNVVDHISNTGLNFVGDLDFRPVPEPASVITTGLGVVSVISLSLIRRRRRPLS